MKKTVIIASAAVLLMASGCGAPATQDARNTVQEVVSNATEPPVERTWQRMNTAQVENAAAPFDFSITIPDSWQVEAVPAVEAFNFYDPASVGETNLEKSQLFVRYFRANNFLTLSTVDIFLQTKTTINNRPAVRYDIAKKDGVANFASQPSWRSQRHIVTDIRRSNASPSLFYVFGQRPGLDDTIYQEVLNSVSFPQTAGREIIAPVAEFRERATKKLFGAYITPDNSPVSPERFSGYHTGVDVEYNDTTADVPVFAVAAGEVRYSGWVSGYGGVLVIAHEIDGHNYLAIYGHLNPASLVPDKAEVAAGEQIGTLGEGYSRQTDNERRHLHFALYAGNDINLQGYVQNEQALDQWQDPLEILK